MLVQILNAALLACTVLAQVLLFVKKKLRRQFKQLFPVDFTVNGANVDCIEYGCKCHIAWFKG